MEHLKITAHSISIHALLAESDWLQLFLIYQDNKFLSTLSLRRATLFNRRLRAIHNAFLSTLSLRRATREEREIIAGLFAISIHALLAESDSRIFGKRVQKLTFLSTLSLRRATGMLCRWPGRCCNFYPRSPCGERRYALPLAWSVL